MIVKEKNAELRMFDRDIIVWVKEYKTGLQRVGAYFAARNKSYLVKHNMELRKKIRELENQLKDKGK